MKDTFVKSYRKTLENEIWRNDDTAWKVFQALLWLANHKTGKWSGGRYQLAGICNQNPNTTYKAIRRLCKAGMVTLSSNTNYTEYTICNWKKYQGTGNTKREISVTTKQHSNKKIEDKNNNISTNVDIQKPAYGRADINEALEYFEQINGYKPSKGKMNRFAITRLLKKMQLSDLLRVIKAAKEAQDEDDYAPRVFNFLDLEQKLPNILDYYRRKENSSSNVIMID